MNFNRRDFGKLALASGMASTKMFGATKPDSKFKGVQIGTITYSYGSMRDQSAEATLGYVVDSGISGIELMGGPVNDWARKKEISTLVLLPPQLLRLGAMVAEADSVVAAEVAAVVVLRRPIR